LRHDDLAQAGAIGRERLLLDPADVEDLATQRHFARHGDVAPDRAATQHTRDGERDRDARAWPVLRDRARREVNVQVAVAKLTFGGLAERRARAHETARRT